MVISVKDIRYKNEEEEETRNTKNDTGSIRKYVYMREGDTGMASEREREMGKGRDKRGREIETGGERDIGGDRDRRGEGAIGGGRERSGEGEKGEERDIRGERERYM